VKHLLFPIEESADPAVPALGVEGEKSPRGLARDALRFRAVELMGPTLVATPLMQVNVL
jgi:hypothetical protein